MRIYGQNFVWIRCVLRKYYGFEVSVVFVCAPLFLPFQVFSIWESNARRQAARSTQDCSARRCQAAARCVWTAARLARRSAPAGGAQRAAQPARRGSRARARPVSAWWSPTRSAPPPPKPWPHRRSTPPWPSLGDLGKLSCRRWGRKEEEDD